MEDKLRQELITEKDFLRHAEKIKNLFSKADRKALELALEKKDLPDICKALSVSEEGLQLLLKSGLNETQNVAMKHPNLANVVKQKK